MRQLLFSAPAHFRGPAALKLHFAWAMHHTFSVLDAPEVISMEDGFQPEPLPSSFT